MQPTNPSDTQKAEPATCDPFSVGEAMLARARSVAEGVTERCREVAAAHRFLLMSPRNLRTDETSACLRDRSMLPHNDRPQSERPLRVLAVDDIADAADALAAVAELLGCEARSCHGGAEAIGILRTDFPDVLLLDLTMPEIDGLQVAAHAHSLAGGRPFLLVATTALGDWEDRTETALAGFHFHLVKPIDAFSLRAVLDRFRAIRRDMESRWGRDGHR